jgi:hypothetical protein
VSNAYKDAALPPFVLLDEPKLAFSVTDPTAVHGHPLKGLAKFGPFDSQLFQAFMPKIRVATIGPASGMVRVGQLLTRLRDRHEPTERNAYATAYPGFNKLLGIDFERAPAAAHIKWPDNVSSLGHGDTPAAKVASALFHAFEQLAAIKDHFDVVTIHFPDAWMSVLRTPDFDAHDVAKAIAARHQIPTQVINDKAIDFNLRSQLCWRLAIAIYVKAGGIPWKLAPLAGVPEDTAYIGLAYAIRKTSDATHFVTCCSQVFDMDGGGMQFVAFEARDPIADEVEARRNPFLSRNDMRSVLVRSLRLYQDRHGGSVPRRLVIHKTTAFKDVELQGVQDAVSAVDEVECIEVGANSSWRGVWMTDSSREIPPVVASKYPVPRGILQYRTGNSALLWVAGNAPSVADGADYFQGGKSIPKPLKMIRHMGRGPFEILALEAMALTKMDWNNDALYDPVPVTIRYSQKLARTIRNVPSLPGGSYPYRLFM